MELERDGIPVDYSRPDGARVGKLRQSPVSSFKASTECICPEKPTSSKWKVPHWKSLNTTAFTGTDPRNAALL